MTDASVIKVGQLSIRDRALVEAESTRGQSCFAMSCSCQ
jgi:hypothetical protein